MKPAPYIPYLIWLQERCDACNDPLINEVSAEFPKQQINQLFKKDFEKAYQRVIGDAMSMSRNPAGGFNVSLDKPRQNIGTFMAFNEYDWVGYISKAVSNAGIPRHDQDSVVSRIVVHLLLKPGKLFKGWDGSTPLEARWKLAVRNAVINARKKHYSDSRRNPALSLDAPDVIAVARNPMPDETLVRFEAQVRRNLGDTAVKLLHHVIEGGDTKDFIGVDGTTRYQVKELKKALKRELLRYSSTDPELRASVLAALEREEATLKQRFGGRRR